MTLPRITADANLLASGAVGIRSRPDAAPVRLLASWDMDAFELILSDHLLSEVEHTLAKRYFVQRLSASERAAFLSLLRRRAVITPVTVHVSGVATHPEDDLVLATALSGDALFVVTGDYQLVRLKRYQGLILVSVQEFLALLPGLAADDEL